MGFLWLAILFSGASLSNPMMLEHKIKWGLPLNLTNSSARNIILKDNGRILTNLTGHLQQKIVNGKLASRGQFCYQVHLEFSDGKSFWFCGGSLVTRSAILTAAHCVQGALTATAVLGALDLSQYEFGRAVVVISRRYMKVHEEYDEDTFYNDIALLTLYKPVKLSSYICTVNLPSCTTTSTCSYNNQFTVSGWGKISDSKLTFRLMYMNVSGQPLSSCSVYYKDRADYTLTQSQMCTSGAFGKSTCNGDSGGPLVQTITSGAVVQQGIVSLGLSSCEAGAPSVYTDVHSFMPWLCSLVNF